MRSEVSNTLKESRFVQGALLLCSSLLSGVRSDLSARGSQLRSNILTSPPFSTARVAERSQSIQCFLIHALWLIAMSILRVREAAGWTHAVPSGIVVARMALVTAT